MNDKLEIAPSGQQIVETAASLLSAEAEAEAKARYAIAVARPRDEDAARQKILKACQRPRFADAARYSRPVGNGERAIGLSIRFAEEAMRAWGNLHQDTYVLFDDGDKRILHCQVVDLESNATAAAPIVVDKTVERRKPRDGDVVVSARQNSQGAQVYRIRADEDALLTKTNNLAAKLRRGLILQLIPADLKDEALEVCAATLSTRDAEDPDAARKRLLDAFFKIGIGAPAVKAFAGKPLEQLTADDVLELRAIYTAVATGEAKWSDFAAAREAGEPLPDELADRIKQRAAARATKRDAP